MRSALILTGTDGLGEALFATGPLGLLGEVRADLGVVMLTSAGSAELLRTDPCIHATVGLDRAEGLIKSRLYVRSAAHGISAALDELGLSPKNARMLALRDRAVYRKIARRLDLSYLVKDITGPGFTGHRTQRIAQALKPFGVTAPSAPIPCRVFGTLDDRGHASRALTGAGIDEARPYVVLHPGSRESRVFRRAASNSREWGTEGFGQLARALAMQGLQVVVTGSGIAERRLVAAVVAIGGDGVVALPDVSLRALYAIVARAAVVVSNDAGPLHLAAAAGAACVGLYGPTDPAVSGPVTGPGRSTVFKPETPGPCEVHPALVAQAIRRLLPKG